MIISSALTHAPAQRFQITSCLFVDYDEIIPGSPRNSHDQLGRCIFNPTNARPNTMYTIRYSLFDSDELQRKIVGKITFRFRYESTDERQILLSAFQFRNHYNVSTNKKSDFSTTRYALTNDVSGLHACAIIFDPGLSSYNLILHILFLVRKYILIHSMTVIL